MAHNCFRCTSPSGCSFVSPHSCFFFIDFPWGVCCLDINLIVVSIFWTLLPLMCQLSERGNKLKNLERLWACTIQSPNWSLPTKLVSCSNFVTEMVWNHNWIGNRELGIAEYHLAQWQVTFFSSVIRFQRGLLVFALGFFIKIQNTCPFFSPVNCLFLGENHVCRGPRVLK